MRTIRSKQDANLIKVVVVKFIGVIQRKAKNTPVILKRHKVEQNYCERGEMRVPPNRMLNEMCLSKKEARAGPLSYEAVSDWMPGSGNGIGESQDGSKLMFAVLTGYSVVWNPEVDTKN
ncbi:MAG: hypothetical protein ABFD98_05500 [Syntrophobacteraceae bacterium]